MTFLTSPFTRFKTERTSRAEASLVQSRGNRGWTIMSYRLDQARAAALFTFTLFLRSQYLGVSPISV